MALLGTRYKPVCTNAKDKSDSSYNWFLYESTKYKTRSQIRSAKIVNIWSITSLETKFSFEIEVLPFGSSSFCHSKLTLLDLKGGV